MSVSHLGMRLLSLVLLGALAGQDSAMAAQVTTPADQDLIRDRQGRHFFRCDEGLRDIRCYSRYYSWLL